MPPNRTAQTSTEVKKAYKKKGPAISERTHKQLQRGYDLEQRAAREREAEKRRKIIKEKREERERKEKAVRQQLGVGLATQLIGYSHTQANLKKGMEAFLGVNKKRQDDERRRKEREEELAKKLEAIAQNIEKEPFDDDDMEDVMLDLPALSEQGGEGWDEDLDDETLLQVHDLVMSDPVEEPVNESISVLPRPATAPPTQAAANSPQPPTMSTTSVLQTWLPPPTNKPKAQPSKLDVGSEELDFTRTHGPINKAVETVLSELPGDIIELLSQDAAAPTSDWTPVQGLLYKLNPLGLPPHRLRLKVGCVVVCLRDLNTSSQLSKSQHVRILRVGNERLECLTLDGQLAGTQTVITRVPFPAKYRNDDKFPFTRTQYPVRVATDYVLPEIPREPAQSGFKLPSINGRPRPSAPVKMAPVKPRTQASPNPSFKLPGLPASKGPSSGFSKPSAPVNTTTSTCALDGWDDFLESGTQIARELSAEVTTKTSVPSNLPRPSPIVETTPPFSTQDLDFSLDDLDDEPQAQPLPTNGAKVTAATAPVRTIKSPPSVRPGPLSRTANIRRIDLQPDRMQRSAICPQKPILVKSKGQMEPPPKPISPAKKPCVPAITTTASKAFDDFGMSTQDATSFFDDDDDLAFGSPPIAV